MQANGRNSHASSVLRNRQKAAIFDMLKEAAPISPQHSAPPGEVVNSWKLLLYDVVGRDILAPLVKVRELRDHGVTLHLMMDSQRDAVPV